MDIVLALFFCVWKCVCVRLCSQRLPLFSILDNIVRLPDYVIVLLFRSGPHVLLEVTMLEYS